MQKLSPFLVLPMHVKYHNMPVPPEPSQQLPWIASHQHEMYMVLLFYRRWYRDCCYCLFDGTTCNSREWTSTWREKRGSAGSISGPKLEDQMFFMLFYQDSNSNIYHPYQVSISNCEMKGHGVPPYICIRIFVYATVHADQILFTLFILYNHICCSV